MNQDRATHWQAVYQSRSPGAVSWYRPHLEVSLALLRQAGLNPESHIIDVGAGASTLVDDLLDLGARHITALDISAADLAALFGAAFTLEHSQHELHATPSGVPQSFAYALLRRLDRAPQAAEPSRPSR